MKQMCGVREDASNFKNTNMQLAGGESSSSVSSDDDENNAGLDNEEIYNKMKAKLERLKGKMQKETDIKSFFDDEDRKRLEEERKLMGYQNFKDFQISN